MVFFCPGIVYCRPPDIPVMPQPVQKTAGPFGLDPNLIADIERDWVRSDQIKETQLSPIDTAFMYQPIKIASSNGNSYPTERLNQLMSNSPSRPQSANASLFTANYHHSPSHNYSGNSRNANETPWVFLLIRIPGISLLPLFLSFPLFLYYHLPFLVLLFSFFISFLSPFLVLFFSSCFVLVCPDLFSSFLSLFSFTFWFSRYFSLELS